MTAFSNFLHMGGYGCYVWPAYGSVLTLLLVQWLIPLRRWHIFLRKHTDE
ncbi:MAG: heme exporter protein CcmD [Gammaproteobacteria bacterium RIFCSPHIGHO2_12_FULL_45_12]|nr:MAG: heme exporter protein CcmD [Gammaproteobacteria bacterium RIFCSPHIGHO2_12_FULL_45_12]